MAYDKKVSKTGVWLIYLYVGSVDFFMNIAFCGVM